MVHGRDESARFHGGEDSFELLADGLFAEMDDAFVISAEKDGVRIAFTKVVDIDARHVLKGQDAFDARLAEPCEAVADVSVRVD